MNIDPSRIYIAGRSNGAMMTYRLDTELSDIVAAIAPCAGTIGGKPTEYPQLYVIPKPACPVSVIAFNGKLDEQVSYDGEYGKDTVGSRIDNLPTTKAVQKMILEAVKENGWIQNSSEIYESKIVNSKEEVINLSNLGHDCQPIGNREWLMRKKTLGQM